MSPADPVGFVVSLNVKRRNMTKQQLAVSAAQAWEMVLPKSRQGVAGREGRAPVLAQQFGVSRAYIELARALVERAPDAAEAVKSGLADLRLAHEALLGAERARSSERDRAERTQRELDALRRVLLPAV